MTDERKDAMPDKLPYAWDEDEAAAARERFRQARPAVPRQLALNLWRYWTQRCPDRALFEDDEDNIALLLHARAYGMRAPTTGVDGGAPAEIAARLPEPDPLTPPPAAWGPRAALAPEVRAALPSLLVRVWVAVDDGGPVEALVVGEGLPEIRQQIVQAALTTSLRINGLTDPADNDLVADHIGVGLIRIGAGVAEGERVVALPSIFGGRGHTSVPDESAATARGVLRDLVTLLRALERETDLVRVTEIRHADLGAFTDSLHALADRAADEPAKAFLRRPDDGETGVVALAPYLPTAHDLSPGLSISPDILATDAYRELEAAHNRVLADRLAMDARLRRDRLSDEIDWLTREKESYDAATPDERRAMWDATVMLVERFDDRMGISIRLAEPEERPTDVYYRANVPQLIRMRQEWLARMSELVDNLDRAVHRPHAPARQLAAGRFVDALLRGVTPDESPATSAAFERWRAEVQPVLWFEWGCALRQREIDPADLFTPHTVLITRYLPPIGDDPAMLFTHPYTLVDQSRSAVLADAERRVLVVRDATDHATPERLSEASESAATAACEALARLAEGSSTGTGGTEFTDAFLAALRAHPRHVSRWLVQQLRPDDTDPAEAGTIDEELAHAVRATELSEGMERALMAMRSTAFRTARECLDSLPGASQWEARAWLLRAIIECAAADMGSSDIPSVLGNRMPGLPGDADHALDQAAAVDQVFTREWLKALPDTTLDKAIRRLFHGVPRARAACSEREYAVLLFRRAVEAVRLARQLEESAEELSDESEATDTVLVKLGQVLEEILVGPFVGGARGQAQDLFVVLTGQEPPTYGRVGVG
ncbi:hypothetical protein [Actinokineospora enzanensis]|uniref:hypothetical protein n=1 Tax=Actinokineospora enzanensis TaxID=155975 RepID=UPI000360993A|nr:hypothetical protein [Actinokineospora enzanensis]